MVKVVIGLVVSFLVGWAADTLIAESARAARRVTGSRDDVGLHVHKPPLGPQRPYGHYETSVRRTGWVDGRVQSRRAVAEKGR